MPIIDIYTHILPQAFADAFEKLSPQLGTFAGRTRAVASLSDLDARFRAMDAVPDYRQVVSMSNPALEDVVPAAQGEELARSANDGLAELCARYPDRFPAFVATVCMLDVDAAVREADRAITQLGARGLQIFTNVAGEPLDLPRFQPLFALLAEHDLPIWMHPTRTAAMADYPAEAKSRYEMWWCFGWPYETSVAMARLVFSGLFDRHPKLRIITHHCGGMIPYFDGRVGPGMALLGSRTRDEDYSGVLKGLKRPHLDYFHDFYADTAMFGSDTGLHAGLRFFGPEKIVFATDAPFGPIRESIEAVERLDLTTEQRNDVMSGNAERLLHLSGR